MSFCFIREFKGLLINCFFIATACINALSQVSSCENLSFESGNFTNWIGHTWLYSSAIPSINSSKLEGIVPRRHTIITDTAAYDANTGNALKKVPPGYRYSARLGDEITGLDFPPRCWNQSLRYTLTIDSSNAFLIIKFALVLEYAEDHTEIQEPRFRFTLFDQDGDTIPDCSNYDVYSSNSAVKGFHIFKHPGGSVPIQWRDWTTVGTNLSDYMGQTITVEFMTADCTLQFHYGYAYFIAECHPLQITVNYCAGDSVAVLAAPEGFKKYKWTGDSGDVIDTTQYLLISDPVEGDAYKCAMVSVTGCKVSLQTVINRYVLNADFDSYMIDCHSNTVQLTNLSTANHGNLIYKWDFGNKNTASEKNPRITFATSGIHQVGLIIANPPSTCTDTLIKDVESFSPPLVGIEGDSTYCPGMSAFLEAYGAYEYTWSNGSKADFIETGAPGGQFWLLGRSSTGCVSDTIYWTVSEELDWDLWAEGDTIICEGETSVLSAQGAVSYLWNTGSKSSSISVTNSGTYHVTGTNIRGCEKSVLLHVIEYPYPDVNFTLSQNTLDSRNNQLICIAPGQTGVRYLWNMGNGSTETGPVIQHTYDIVPGTLAYTITLTATNEADCSDDTSRIIDVILFIPNVFTPNGDGVNDIFMEGYELEIIDRNGILLYKGISGWDGKYKGRYVDADTYFYSISYIDRHRLEHLNRGFVTVIR